MIFSNCPQLMKCQNNSCKKNCKIDLKKNKPVTSSVACDKNPESLLQKITSLILKNPKKLPAVADSCNLRFTSIFIDGGFPADICNRKRKVKHCRINNPNRRYKKYDFSQNWRPTRKLWVYEAAQLTRSLKVKINVKCKFFT